MFVVAFKTENLNLSKRTREWYVVGSINFKENMPVLVWSDFIKVGDYFERDEVMQCADESQSEILCSRNQACSDNPLN
jgi:hypothetical protein